MRLFLSLIFMIFICGNYLLTRTDTSSTLIAANFIDKFAGKSNFLEQKLDKKSEKVLAELQQHEAKMKRMF